MVRCNQLGRNTVRGGTYLAAGHCRPGRELRIDVTGVVARVDKKQRAGVRFTYIGTRELQVIRDLIGRDDDERTDDKNERTVNRI